MFNTTINTHGFMLTFGNILNFLSLLQVQRDLFNVLSQRGGVRSISVVRAFAHGAMDHRIDPSWGGPIELFLLPASAPKLV